MRPWLRRLAFPLALAGGALAILLVRPASDGGPGRIARLDPPQYRPVPGLTDAEGAASTEFQRAVEHYRDGRWDEGAADFAAAARIAGEGSVRAREARLYEGLCRLFAGKTAESVAPLMTASEEETFEIRIRARWYLAQAHLLLEDTESALPLLEELSRTPAYARDASRQLLLLKNR